MAVISATMRFDAVRGGRRQVDSTGLGAELGTALVVFGRLWFGKTLRLTAILIIYPLATQSA